MKKKLNGEAGFTLVEMLAATAILILLTMMLGTGLQMTVRSYQKITAQSEVDLLLSTAMDALTDDLRFAWNVENYDGDEKVPFTYTSDSFAGIIHLELDETTGQIMAANIRTEGDSKRFLSTGAYGVKKSGEERAYKVTNMEIKPSYIDTDTDSGTDPNTFTIYLEVQASADASIKAEGEITVRCLNKMKDTE